MGALKKSGGVLTESHLCFKLKVASFQAGCNWPLLETGRCCSVSVYTGAPPSTSQCLNSSRGQAQICVNCYSKCTQQILTKPVFLPIVHFTSIITISITIITIMTLTTTITQTFTITITNIIITTTTTKL